MTHKVIIIGAGPAGYTAAIYTGRALLNPLLLTGSPCSSQLTMASEVENYPGFYASLSGVELINNFRKHAEKFGTRFIEKSVSSVNFSVYPFEIFTDDEKLQALSVIIATGSAAKWLGLESERKLIGRGVSACAICDAGFFKGKDVMVIGGGDAAVHDALYLQKYAKSVTVIHRRDKLRASRIYQDRAFSQPKIKFMWNCVVEEIMGVEEGRVKGVRVRNVKTNQEDTVSCEGVFIAIGHTPNTALFKGVLELDEKGYIKVRDGTCTNVAGVFACGDVVDPVYRQAVVAAGSGCMAALDCIRFLEKKA
jgi:thioredoxin reductase (NADPH)